MSQKGRKSFQQPMPLLPRREATAVRPWSPSLYTAGQTMQETHFPEPPCLGASELEDARQGRRRKAEAQWSQWLSWGRRRMDRQTDTPPHRCEVLRGQNGLLKTMCGSGLAEAVTEGASWDSTPSEISSQCCRQRLTTGASTIVFSSNSFQANS